MINEITRFDNNKIILEDFEKMYKERIFWSYAINLY